MSESGERTRDEKGYFVMCKKEGLAWFRVLDHPASPMGTFWTKCV